MKSLREKLKLVEYNNFYPLFFTITFILILIQYSFNSLDAIFYDLWIRADIKTNPPEEIVLVPMDEESDQFLGEIYPYTYATHMRFSEKLVEDSPKVINYLVPFLEPETENEWQYSKEFFVNYKNFNQSGGNFRFGTDKDPWGEQIPPDNLVSLGYSWPSLITMAQFSPGTMLLDVPY